MNLTICLLMARRFVEREQIRELVAGYQGLSDAAFERTFERDKDELRALGVPVETGSNSSLFPDEVGYRIRRRDFELPEIDSPPAELAALVVASTVRDAHVRDLDVTVLEDGCAAPTPTMHAEAIAALKPVARVATIAEVLAEVGTP